MLALLWAQPVGALPFAPVAALPQAQKSDVVLIGKVLSIGETAHVTVEEVLKGTGIPAQIEVSPVKRSFDAGTVKTFEPQQEVLLFLRKGDVWQIGDNGWATINLTLANKTQTIEGVKKLLVLPGETKEDTDSAMVGWAASDNLFLRAQSHNYISLNLSHSPRAVRYKTQFMELLAHPDTDVQIAAIRGLQYVTAPEALPLLIQASHSDNKRVVQEASLALGKYDTPESVAAVAGLTQHPDQDVRIRASIDLDLSRRGEAKAALVALLGDLDPKVRAFGARGLMGWLERGEANEVLPRLFELLEDPNPETQEWTALALSRARHASALEPLLKRLQRKEMSGLLENRVMEAIDKTYERVDATSRSAVDMKLDIIIAELERGPVGASMSAVSVLARNNSPKAVAALQRASQNHPRQEIREYATRMLPQ